MWALRIHSSELKNSNMWDQPIEFMSQETVMLRRS